MLHYTNVIIFRCFENLFKMSTCAPALCQLKRELLLLCAKHI